MTTTTTPKKDSATPTPTATKTLFADFQLSKETLTGLKAGGYKTPTSIQHRTLELALDGKDVWGTAVTGSGKTLAFLLPLLECLHKDKWTQADGVGAIVITPTRELAYQIFEVLRIVGRKHNFSAALVIGGKDLALERTRLDRINIIVCTPGRLLQHMDESPLFSCDNLKMLVIDEADRILDMGFKATMDSIIKFLPKQKQCLLFSATQSDSVQQLARLSLREPHFASVDQPTSTPDKLRQHFTEINAEQKLSFLWSFIKHHKKSKVLVFIATCKQTRFLHRLLSRLQPGISINALYGTMHQLKRMDVYNKFSDVRHCVLLSTDVASRGLDFPDVDWVVQLDCPDDVNSYIHRAGRTARHDKAGRSLMVLMPNERDFVLAKLKEKGISIEELPTKSKHLMPVEGKVTAALARDVELKEEAKRAFKCYLKCLLNARNKHLFDIKKFNLVAYAKSLGLAVMPRVRILERKGIDKKNLCAQNEDDDDENDNAVSESDSDDDDGGDKSGVPSIKEMKNKEKQAKAKLQANKMSLEQSTGGLNPFEISDEVSDEDDDDDEEFLKPVKTKRVLPAIDGFDDEAAADGKANPMDVAVKKLKLDKPMSKAKLAKKLIKKNIKVSSHKVFE